MENRARPLEKLLLLLSTSQSFADVLVNNPDFLDMLRVPLRSSPGRDELREQLQAEVEAAFEDSAVLRAFRRFRATCNHRLPPARRHRQRGPYNSNATPAGVVDIGGGAYIFL